jgi:hypothetical protein
LNAPAASTVHLDRVQRDAPATATVHLDRAQRDAPATATVHLDRAHRNTIRDHIASEFHAATDVELMLSHGNRERIVTVIHRLRATVGVLDQLGWGEHGDRDSYELALDRETAAFMRQLNLPVRILGLIGVAAGW